MKPVAVCLFGILIAALVAMSAAQFVVEEMARSAAVLVGTR